MTDRQPSMNELLRAMRPKPPELPATPPAGPRSDPLPWHQRPEEIGHLRPRIVWLGGDPKPRWPGENIYVHDGYAMYGIEYHPDPE
jgi:hypothetical protein